MFPLQVLHDFRKNIREASKSKDKLKQKRYPSNDEEGPEKSMVSEKATKITKRLYLKPEPFLGERDCFGNRCSIG